MDIEMRLLIIVLSLLVVSCNSKKQKTEEIHSKSIHKFSKDFLIKDSLTKVEIKDTLPPLIFNTIDTNSIDGKFLKVFTEYSQTTQQEKIIAEWGTKNNSFRNNLTENDLLGTSSLKGSLKLISKNNFLLIDGCGQSCKIALIFNVNKLNVVSKSIDYYYENYKTDNKNLIISAERNDSMELSLAVYDISIGIEKSHRINIDTTWERGMGRIDEIIDELVVEQNRIKVTQRNVGVVRQINGELSFN